MLNSSLGAIVFTRCTLIKCRHALWDFIDNPSLSDCNIDNDGYDQFLGHSNVRVILILVRF